MWKGIIYLIQPTELINTNRYKIGCSTKNNLDRCNNGYKKNTRYICIMECINPLLLEKKLINIFNSKFKLIAGKEYFEGDESSMLTIFFETIYNNNNNYEINTYIDYLKVSNIKKIIITNKKLYSGYIILKNLDQWYNIDNKDLLLKFMEDNIYSNNVYKNIITNDIIIYDKIKNLTNITDNYISINVIYNYNSIINDIIKN